MTETDNTAQPEYSTYATQYRWVDLSWFWPRNVRRLRPRPGTALVLYRYGRLVRVVRPEERFSRWRTAIGRFTGVAYLDMRPYDLTFRGRLPCRGGAHDFEVVVRLTCALKSPDEVMKGNIAEAGERLHRRIFERVSQVNHQHCVNDVITAREHVDARLQAQIDQLEPAFTVTNLSVEIVIDECLRELLKGELEREYHESVVRNGVAAIAAEHLRRNPQDPQTAIKILQQHRREVIQLHREEEEYLIRHEIIRPEQREERALERLDRLDHLEPPLSAETITTIERDRPLSLEKDQEG